MTDRTRDAAPESPAITAEEHAQQRRFLRALGWSERAIAGVLGTPPAPAATPDRTGRDGQDS
jgi:hypothetical protein